VSTPACLLVLRLLEEMPLGLAVDLGSTDLRYTALSVNVINALQLHVAPPIVRRFVCIFLFYVQKRFVYWTRAGVGVGRSTSHSVLDAILTCAQKLT